MNMQIRKQHGAILVMTAILIIVLIGIAAIALDLGRVFVQRSEVQNAADAAALAAAAELDGKVGAQNRAMNAARQLLTDRGIYFGDFSPDEDITKFRFYNSLGTRADPTKVPATGDLDSIYVELTVDLTQEGEGLPLFFAPVLNLLPFGDEPLGSEAGTRARALAGRQTLECFEPPLFMCVNNLANFFDTNTGNDPIKTGEMVWLKAHGGGDSWTPGNFAFLESYEEDAQSGAKGLQEFLAGAGERLCVPTKITSKTGESANKARTGFNTRFDLYEQSMTASNYPPAPNVIDFPRDDGLPSDADRIGDGMWGDDASGVAKTRNWYWNTYHAGVSPRPSGWNTWSRYRTYLWEMGLDANGNPLSPYVTNMAHMVGEDPTVAPCNPADKQTYNPNICHGEPEETDYYCLDGDQLCQDIYNNIYPPGTPGAKSDPPTTEPDRRTLYVAVLDCAKAQEEFNLNGKIKDFDVELPNGTYAKMFLTEHVYPGGSDTDPFEFYAEFIKLTAEPGTGEIRVKIQLYE